MAKSKTLLITGAAKRIGRHLAIHMAKSGWNIALHYNNSDEDARSLAKEIENQNVDVALIKADLSDSVQVRRIFKEADDKLGKIDCLINNASMFKNDKIENLSEDLMQEQMQVNCYAPVILSQEFVKQSKFFGGTGYNVINMLDYCVVSPPDKFLSYFMSKASLWAATQSLAKQIAPNIRINAIGLGHALPNENETQASFEQAFNQTPLQINTSLDEICGAVDFIIKSSSLTGQIINLDSGKHLVGADYY